MNGDGVRNILFTGAGSPGTVSLFESLRAKYSLYFADSNISRVDPSIPAERVFALPSCLSDDYFSFLDEIIKTHQINLIIPTIDEELESLKLRFDQSSEVDVLLPHLNFVRTCLDKYQLGVVLGEMGINEPSTRLLSDDPVTDGNYIVKPRTGRGSRNVFSGDQTLVRALSQVFSKNRQDWVVQKKIEGQEFTIQMIADSSGNLKRIVPLRINLKRSVTIAAELDNNPAVISYARSIHEAFRPCGVYNIQLISSDSGQSCIEINPRISTTLCVAAFSGIDFIDIFYSQNNFAPVLLDNNWKLERFWKNVITVKT